MEVEEFGRTKDGTTVHKFTLQTSCMKVCLTSYGASLIQVWCLDKHGTYDDILLGFDSLTGYLENPYFGSTIGRFANRIAKGKFSLQGVPYVLVQTNGENHLHGGDNGFHSKVWSWKGIENGVEFELISEDGDEGYPGTLNVSVSYIIKDNRIQILFNAHTKEKATVVNLTNHAFINLAGQRSNTDILDHLLHIRGEKYLPHRDGIPLCVADAVAAHDFHTKAKRIGDDIGEVDGGYDHNYCLNHIHTQTNENSVEYSARLEHPASGRVLEIITDQPGLQFYSGNFLDVVGKNGLKYVARSGLCLEGQNYPNNVNEDSFPSSRLLPGEMYTKHITWKLYTDNNA